MATLSSSLIPQNKPRSWVVFILSVFAGLCSGGIAFLGAWLHFEWLFALGRVLFVLCVACGFVFWFVMITGMVSGRYKNLTAKPWRNQVW
jgi:hypothetical protein